jgi:hypothetical protein
VNSLSVFTAVGIIALAALVWLFLRTWNSDQLDEIVNKHRPTAKLSTKADFVEGMNHIPVALSLEGSDLLYENPDLQAKLEIARIDEVEYVSELATGSAVDTGKVLRVRSHGHAFEFILDPQSAARWSAALPPHRFDDASQANAV